MYASVPFIDIITANVNTTACFAVPFIFNFQCSYLHRSCNIDGKISLQLYLQKTEQRARNSRNMQQLRTVCREQLIFTCRGGSLGNVRDAIVLRTTDFLSAGDFNCLQHTSNAHAQVSQAWHSDKIMCCKLPSWIDLNKTRLQQHIKLTEIISIFFFLYACHEP